jgi:hypothetical protein
LDDAGLPKQKLCFRVWDESPVKPYYDRLLVGAKGRGMPTSTESPIVNIPVAMNQRFTFYFIGFNPMDQIKGQAMAAMAEIEYAFRM